MSGLRREVCGRLGRHAPHLSADAREALVAYPWPGNVRELFNALERIVLLCPEGMCTARCPSIANLVTPDTSVTGLAEDPGSAECWRGRPLLEARKEVADRFECQYLIDVLRSCDGRIGEAARYAGISPRSLSEMMKRHGLRRREFWRKPVARP